MEKEKFLQPEPRKDIIKHLSKDAERYRGSTFPIFLSFTTDPYQPIEREFQITRQALEILTANNCAINILTKGGSLACRDFDILQQNPRNWFGVTLTYGYSHASEAFEPGAALPHYRIKSLKTAKYLGINTWVSLEPIMSPTMAMELIRATIDFTDLYKIGKLNHQPGMGPSGEELRAFLKEALELLEANGKRYYIKQDTRPFLK